MNSFFNDIIFKLNTFDNSIIIDNRMFKDELKTNWMHFAKVNDVWFCYLNKICLQILD